ncbi:MAG TPA: TlpA disulfide reductase family protein [Stellaceae bacterium]|nr:TlpA disulfide reductase family protein [Stellaceae bacterium]
MTLGRRRFLAAHLAALLLIAVPGGALWAQSGDIKLGEFIPQNPPQPAPAISFTDIAGKPVKLSDFKGTVTLVNLWATWCHPCLKEMPSLEKLQASHQGALKVLAISEDHGGAAVVAPFIKKQGLAKLAIYLDPESNALHGFKARGLPTSILIGKDGTIIGRVEGGTDWQSDAIAAALKPLLPPG